MVQLQASVSEMCEERDTLQGKVTLLTSNARRMDRDMKRLQADYDKLYSHKQQGGEQVCVTRCLKFTGIDQYSHVPLNSSSVICFLQ